MESIFAIMILGLIGSAVLSGVSTLHISGSKTKARSDFENVARNQMEDTLNQTYQNPPFTYPSIPAPAGCTATSQAEEYVVNDPNIEKITVTVSCSGYDDYVFETLRTK